MKLRRSTDPLRLDMLPLLDVIFLLMTFFIFAQAVMIHARVLPITLPRLDAAQRPDSDQPTLAIRVDTQGRIALNQQPITLEALQSELRQQAQRNPQPRIVLAFATPNTPNTPNTSNTSHTPNASDQTAGSGVQGRQASDPQLEGLWRVDRWPIFLEIFQAAQSLGYERIDLLAQPMNPVTD